MLRLIAQRYGASSKVKALRLHRCTQALAEFPRMQTAFHLCRPTLLTSLLEEPLVPILRSGYATKAGKKKHGKPSKTAAEDVANELDMQEVQGWMQQPLQRLKTNLGGIRAGRASPGMLDIIKVAAYGDQSPSHALKSLATVSVRSPQVLAVGVFDRSTLHAVEKAIRGSPMNLNPQIEQEEILVHVPRPSKEAMDAMAKVLRSEGEAAKVAIRQARKRALDIAKTFGSEDDRKKVEKQVQGMTDASIREIDDACATKTKELASSL